MSKSNTKRYGVDGPPQLHGLNQPLTREIVRFLGWEDSESEEDDWVCQIVCSCKCSTRLKILQGSEKANEKWLQGRWGEIITDLVCASCGFCIPFFHEGFHGYNAVVCGEREEMPLNYVKTNKGFLKPIPCDQCGGDEFSVAALARYDDDELRSGSEDTPVEHWDDAYGWFHADAWCSGCQSVKEMFVGHETA